MEWLFWISLVLVAYSYAGYPLLLSVVGWFLPRKSGDSVFASDDAVGEAGLPTVTIIIPAHNEAAALGSKIQSCLELDYPADRLDVLVFSDGSTDDTEEKVRSYVSSRLRLVAHPCRRGKMHVLNEAVSLTRAEIVVLSDAEARFHPQALRRLVRHFRSPQVAAVFGWREMKGGQGEKSRESAYWRYEKWLRCAEDRIGASIVCSGAILALRRHTFRPLASGLICDDLFIPLDLRARGWQLVFEPCATVCESPTAMLEGDFLRRIRLSAGGFQSLRYVGANLAQGDFRGLFAYVSHKLLRWLTPFFLLAALGANLTLLGTPLYQGLLGVGAVLCGVALYGFWCERQGRPARLLGLPFYFLAMNLAFFLGALRWVAGSQKVTWERI